MWRNLSKRLSASFKKNFSRPVLLPFPKLLSFPQKQYKRTIDNLHVLKYQTQNKGSRKKKKNQIVNCVNFGASRQVSSIWEFIFIFIQNIATFEGASQDNPTIVCLLFSLRLVPLISILCYFFTICFFFFSYLKENNKLLKI